MKIRIEKSFAKDVHKIKDKKLLQNLSNIIAELENSTSIREISHIKKIKGYKTFFRIRIGDYRLGLEGLPGKGLYLIRFLHRKEIYRYFPDK